VKSIILIRDPENKDQERTWTVFDEISRKVKEAKTTAGGASDAESKYSINYQNLVKAGLVNQIKKKYR
jgi:hypothetical protein